MYDFLFFALPGTFFCFSIYLLLRQPRFSSSHVGIATPQNFRRYLLAHGWTEPWQDEMRPRLDKGGLRITVTCIASDPANRGAVLMATDVEQLDGRHFVVFAPGVVPRTLVDDMLRHNISVVPYSEIEHLDDILRENVVLLDRYRAEDKDRLTKRLDPPVPEMLISAVSSIDLGSNRAGECVLLGETPRVQCFFRGSGTDKLLISFNDSWRSGASGRLHPAIDTEKLGYAIVDFVSTEQNWFPADDMAALIPLLLGKLEGRFSELITFGFSQGGYGAIKYSRMLGATTTMAFSPQMSIDPRIVKDNRFSRYFNSNLHIGMSISQGDCICPTYLFYDPYEIDDREQVGLLSLKATLSEVRVPFSGHATRTLFDTNDKLKLVVDAAAARDIDCLLKFSARTRRQSRDRSYLLAMHLAQTRPSNSLRVANAYRAAWTQNQQSNLCYRLANNGQVEAAFSRVIELASNNQDDPEIQGCAALVSLKAGDAVLAFRFADRALTIDPESTKWRRVRSDVTKLWQAS